MAEVHYDPAKEQRRFKLTQFIMTSISMIAVLVGFVAMTVMWLNAEEARDVAQAEVQQLRDSLDRQVQGTGACDALFATACDGLRSCVWRWEIQDKVVGSKDVDAWMEALRKQDVGLVACKKSYPNGAEYQGGSR
jgi:hypothetical protein